MRVQKIYDFGQKAISEAILMRTHNMFLSLWRTQKLSFINQYLHLPLTFLRWTILDQLASYTDEGRLIMWRR